MSIQSPPHFDLKAQLTSPEPFLPSTVLLHRHLDLVGASTDGERLDILKFDGSRASSTPLDQLLEDGAAPCQTSVKLIHSENLTEAETLSRWSELLPSCDELSTRLVKDIEKVSNSNPCSPQSLTIRSLPGGCGVTGKFRGYEIGPWRFSEHLKPSSKVTHLASTGYQCVALVQDLEAAGPESAAKMNLISFSNLKSNGAHLATVSRSCALISRLIEYVSWGTDWARLNWQGSRRSLDNQISIVEEALSEAKCPDLVTSLYTLAVTGVPNEPLNAWLTDGMGTQGINRWYGTFGVGLKMVLDTCEQYLMPALDWATVELHELRSLSGHPNRPICQIEPKLLTAIQNDLEVLRTTLHSVSDYVADELHQVHVFGEWLMNQHLMLLDDTSTLAKEAEKKIPETDYPSLLAFIQGALTCSHLKIFFGRDEEQIGAAARRPRQSAMPRIVDAMLKRHRDTPMQPKSPVVELINLKYLTLFLEDSKSALTKHVQNTFTSAAKITEDYCNKPLSKARYLDLRMVTELGAPQLGVSDTACIYLLSLRSNLQPTIVVTRWADITMARAKAEGLAEAHKHHQLVLAWPEGSQIRDVKFLDDTHMVYLTTQSDGSSLVQMIPYCYRAFESNEGSGPPIGSSFWRDIERQSNALDVSPSDMLPLERMYPRIELPHTGGPHPIAPESILTRCTKLNRRVLIISEDCKNAQVWDLDLTNAEEKFISPLEDRGETGLDQPFSA